MSNQRWIVLIALLFSTVVACSWWMSGRPGWEAADDEEGAQSEEPTIVEIQPVDTIIFDHSWHVGGVGFGCVDCHANVATANDLSENQSPAMDDCSMCHELDNCEMCHTDLDARLELVPVAVNLGFSHSNHLSRAGDDCTLCHTDVMESAALPLAVPTMDGCLGCHNHEEDYAAGRCDHCHPNLQEQPLAALAEFDHVGDWTQTHGLLARAESASCMACHGESMCADCHSSVAPDMPAALFPEAVDRSLLHRGDWLATHSLEARTTPDACARCHSHEADFCEDCHTVSMLTPASTNPVGLHPAGWLNPSDPDFHGVEARLHINSCAACHDQGAASNCVECHAVGRVGGNPHPVGWGDDDDLDDAHQDPMCRICHSF